jgi:asparagine synthase (glutamine-hydrolysing)
MCGIAGFIDFTKKTEENQLHKMTDSLHHRGPDGSGYAFFNTSQCHIGLGHRRLSIIDLSALGNQPMYSSDKQLVITFNGEIYNYAEIRDELRKKGYSFVSGSDTEVMLNAYREWGTEAVQRFIGMFTFVLYDIQKNCVFIFRDRAGVKPLYYYWKNDLFLFGSELKSFFNVNGFEKEIDTTSFTRFLQYSYVPAPYSIFKNTWKLEPGFFMVIDLSTKKITTEQYWNVLDYYKKDKIEISEEEAQAELESRLKKACEYRMVSDVPVGLFLSGGYDSTLVAAMLQTGRTDKIKTYTIGFPEKKYDEAGHAAKVAAHLGTEHHEMYCDYDQAKSIIPHLPFYFDEPFGDSSAIPTILVSRFARQEVKVALSADGGDELFAGYERHAALLKISGKVKAVAPFVRKPLAFVLKHTPGFLLNKIAPGKNISPENIAKYSRFIRGKMDIVDMADYANQTSMPDFLMPFIQHKSNGHNNQIQMDGIRKLPGDLDKLLAFDYVSYLPGDILTKVDRATMSISLEGREPLLDQNIIEWVATLPDHFKYNNGVSKYLLRKIVHKYVPSSVMSRPKMGFAIPLTKWFREDLKYLFHEYLNETSLNKHGLVNVERLLKELDEYYAGNDFRFPLLWNILVFQLWYEKWID